jgi:ATP-binding cassette subfamily B protein
VLAIAFVGAALGAIEPLALKVVFDELGGRRSPAVLVGGVAAALAVLFLRELVTMISDRRIWKVRIAVHYRITRAVVGRLYSLPLSFHREEGVGAVMTKMDRGINGFIAAFSDVAFNVLPSILYLALAATLMFELDWRLSLFVLALAPFPALVGALAAREQTDRERALLHRWSKLFARLNEVLAGIAVVKSFAMEDIERRRFLAGVEEANALVVRGVATDSKTTAAKNVAAGLARVGALALGGWLILRGEISLGTLLAFVGYVGALFGPVQGLTTVYQTFKKGAVSLETIFSILDAHDGLGDREDARDVETVTGAVDFDAVSFGYHGRADVLRGIDLHVRPGETVALVGPSGAGKTTIVKLLQRLYDPTAGIVRVDGNDLRELKQRSLRRHIGVVLQHGGLFNDSIRENVAFGRPGASDAEIEAAARAANAHDFIMTLQDGYDTVVGERGASLSGGQVQRIEIARAILKDPAILVLDEATSALDAASEVAVQDALARLKRGRTTFVIAHRLSTVVDADRIVLISGGRISEMGTHDELVRAGGEYASLVAHQMDPERRRRDRSLSFGGRALGDQS